MQGTDVGQKEAGVGKLRLKEDKALFRIMKAMSWCGVVWCGVDTHPTIISGQTSLQGL